MARTQAADYAARREAIVETAATLFAQRGFLGASVAALATACQASKSLIYHYYASKEDILYAVMASHIDALLGAAEGIAKARRPAQAKLDALAHALMRLYVGAAARHKVLVNDLDCLPPARRREIVAKQRRLIAMVEGLLEEIDPTLPASRRKAAAMLFFGMINWTHTWFDPEGAVSAESLADMVAGLMRKGVKGLVPAET
ncbi:MAG: TetR/AcrR family transcriptional regulator [Pseudomonadota bacterium]